MFSSKPLKLEWLNKILVSLANNTGMDLLFITFGKSFIHMRKSKGPSDKSWTRSQVYWKAVCAVLLNLTSGLWFTFEFSFSTSWNTFAVMKAFPVSTTESEQCLWYLILRLIPGQHFLKCDDTLHILVFSLVCEERSVIKISQENLRSLNLIILQLVGKNILWI